VAVDAAGAAEEELLPGGSVAGDSSVESGCAERADEAGDGLEFGGGEVEGGHAGRRYAAADHGEKLLAGLRTYAAVVG
jgi:hypothetical protein